MPLPTPRTEHPGAVLLLQPKQGGEVPPTVVASWPLASAVSRPLMGLTEEHMAVVTVAQETGEKGGRGRELNVGGRGRSHTTVVTVQLLREAVGWLYYRTFCRI